MTRPAAEVSRCIDALRTVLLVGNKLIVTPKDMRMLLSNLRLPDGTKPSKSTIRALRTALDAGSGLSKFSVSKVAKMVLRKPSTPPTQQYSTVKVDEQLAKRGLAPVNRYDATGLTTQKIAVWLWDLRNPGSDKEGNYEPREITVLRQAAQHLEGASPADIKQGLAAAYESHVADITGGASLTGDRGRQADLGGLLETASAEI